MPHTKAKKTGKERHCQPAVVLKVGLAAVVSVARRRLFLGIA